MKYFEGGITPDDVLWKYSWANVVMWLATVPEIDLEDKEEETTITSTKELTADLLKKHNLL